MDDAAILRWRERLESQRAELDAQDALGRDGRATVTLDQQSVGRLSRMDAMQQQAMAQATNARRDAMRQRIRAALARIDDGEFGFCTECGEEIATARLDLDPTVPTCISCASG